MNTSLAKVLNWEKEPDFLDLNICDLVKAASKSIAPLGPINTFAARNPWVGLEEQPFEQVARRFQHTCNVDLLPNESIFLSAWKRGEINQDFLEESLQQWLDSQNLDLQREEVERYCLAGLNLEKQSGHTVSTPEVKILAKKLNKFYTQISKEHGIQTKSQRLENLNGERVAQELNSHIIKWCKLFLNQTHSVWSMPNREKGFYYAWRRLVQYDPSLNKKQQSQLKNLNMEADHALKEALLALEIPNSKIQNYLEAHLLALPGWAGMMLWRSKESPQENSLLMEYLAVRISMEAILVKPHLPLPKQTLDNKVNVESLILTWIDWGKLPINAWSKFSAKEIMARLTLAYHFDRILHKLLWLEAWEKTYENQLMQTITSKQDSEKENVKQTKAQFVFCIDVRSEVFRRKLEEAGDFETLGISRLFRIAD